MKGHKGALVRSVRGVIGPDTISLAPWAALALNQNWLNRERRMRRESMNVGYWILSNSGQSLSRAQVSEVALKLC